MSSLQECSACKGKVSELAQDCPHCGHPQKFRGVQSMRHLPSMAAYFIAVLIYMMILVNLYVLYEQSGGWPWEWAWNWNIGIQLVIAGVAAALLESWATDMVMFDEYQAYDRASKLTLVLAVLCIYVWKTNESAANIAWICALVCLVGHVICRTGAQSCVYTSRVAPEEASANTKS